MATPTEMRFWLRTFGCQMNIYDSGKMRAQLASKGYRTVPSIEGPFFTTGSPQQSVLRNNRNPLGFLRWIWSAQPMRVQLASRSCICETFCAKIFNMR